MIHTIPHLFIFLCVIGVGVWGIVEGVKGDDTTYFYWQFNLEDAPHEDIAHMVSPHTLHTTHHTTHHTTKGDGTHF
jgi:hypothetical protein